MTEKELSGYKYNLIEESYSPKSKNNDNNNDYNNNIQLNTSKIEEWL